MFGLISDFITLFLGTLYPAYLSFKSLKYRNATDQIKCLIYWVVFSVFMAVERVANIFLFWFPFYSLAKVTLVLWFLSPHSKGPIYLYRAIVSPWLSEREQQIDEFIERVKSRGLYMAYQSTMRFVITTVNTLVQIPGGFGVQNPSTTVRRSKYLEEDDDYLPEAPYPVRRRTRPTSEPEPTQQQQQQQQQRQSMAQTDAGADTEETEASDTVIIDNDAATSGAFDD